MRFLIDGDDVLGFGVEMVSAMEAKYSMTIRHHHLIGSAGGKAEDTRQGATWMQKTRARFQTL